VKKILLIQTKHSPYHVARLEAIVEECTKRDWEVKSVELSPHSKEYEWKNDVSSFNYIIPLIEDRAIEDTNFIVASQKLFALLNKIKPDVVVLAGYARWILVLALLWCKFSGVPSVLMSESKEDDAKRYFVKEWIKGWGVKLFDASLVGGVPHKRYLAKLGFDENSIFVGYDVVGNDYFIPTKIRQLPRPIEKSYFLAINRFIRKKNISFIVEAYAKYREIVKEKAFDLVLAGGGELFGVVQAQVNKLEIQPFVHFPGFLQIDELLPFFAHASSFIHASSQEQWGLVVNEAMASGLPVFVSNLCGCFEDLVIDGVNGYGFNPSNIDELVELMVKSTTGEIDLIAFGSASLERIQLYSPKFHAQQLIKAVEVALK
jgi:glycosyltransferase involved in cell wall biosynthesis